MRWVCCLYDRGDLNLPSRGLDVQFVTQQDAEGSVPFVTFVEQMETFPQEMVLEDNETPGRLQNVPRFVATFRCQRDSFSHF